MIYDDERHEHNNPTTGLRGASKISGDAGAQVFRLIAHRVAPRPTAILTTFGIRSRRKAAASRSPVIVYTVEGEDVLVLRVAHGRRDIQELFPR